MDRKKRNAGSCPSCVLFVCSFLFFIGPVKRGADFELQSGAFDQGEGIPRKYTCDGSDVSPQLTWKSAPEGTQSFALTVTDPDAPSGTWVHWVIFQLPGDSRGIPEGMPKKRELAGGALQGKNDFGNIGYGGPCPPRGSAHRYFFRLYALDSMLGLKAGAGRPGLEKAMKGHVLGHAVLMGRYRRAAG